MMNKEKVEHIKNMIDEQNALEKFHGKFHKVKFVRVKGECGVIIIPIEYYLKGLDFENYGISTKFVEEDSKKMQDIVWDKDNFLKELKGGNKE